MEIIFGLFILIGIIITLAKIFKGKSRRERPAEKVPNNIVKVIDRKENEKGLLINIDVDETYVLHCQIYRDGSPSVDISDGRETYRYYVNTHKWKDGNIPDGTADREYVRKIGALIHDEWTRAWEKYGKPEFISDRKPPTPAPKFVDFSIREIDLKYESTYLSSLPLEYTAADSDENEYNLNLQKLECSCPDFEKRRREFINSDLRRVCKHQAKAIIALGKNTKITNDTMIQSLIRVSASIGRGIPIYDKFVEVKINEPIKGENPFYVLMSKDNEVWAKIFFFTKREYIDRGYNKIEKRWDHHENPFPPGSRQKYNFVVQKVLGIE